MRGFGVRHCIGRLPGGKIDYGQLLTCGRSGNVRSGPLDFGVVRCNRGVVAVSVSRFLAGMWWKEVLIKLLRAGIIEICCYTVYSVGQMDARFIVWNL